MTKNMIHTGEEEVFVSSDRNAVPAWSAASAVYIKRNASAYQSEIEKLSDEWEEAGISNAFLFGKIMTTEPGILLELLQNSLPEMGITSIHDAGREVDIKLSIDSHGVRLDVSAKDNAGRTIDIEMQLKDEQNVPKRMRYYSGAIDQTILEKGINYSRLSDTVVLFITLFDPFGKDLIRYSFQNICLEDRELKLGDGTTKIVLNAIGTRGNVSEELKGFLDLVAGIKDVKKNSFADRVQKQVAIARKNPEWRRQYMEWKMTLLNEREKGREEGAVLERIEMVEKKIKKGMNLPEIADDMEKDIETIRPIWDAIKETGPEYDREKIFQAICARDT